MSVVEKFWHSPEGIWLNHQQSPQISAYLHKSLMSPARIPPESRQNPSRILPVSLGSPLRISTASSRSKKSFRQCVFGSVYLYANEYADEQFLTFTVFYTHTHTHTHTISHGCEESFSAYATTKHGQKIHLIFTIYFLYINWNQQGYVNSHANAYVN